MEENTFKKHAKNMLAFFGEFVPENTWVSVKDKLPDYGEFVLVCVGDHTILKGRLMRNGWVASFLDGEKLVGEIREVTHWRQLPALPNSDHGSTSEELC